MNETCACVCYTNFGDKYKDRSNINMKINSYYFFGHMDITAAGGYIRVIWVSFGKVPDGKHTIILKHY